MTMIMMMARHFAVISKLDTLCTGDVLTANELRTKRLLPIPPGQNTDGPRFSLGDPDHSIIPDHREK